MIRIYEWTIKNQLLKNDFQIHLLGSFESTVIDYQCFTVTQGVLQFKYFIFSNEIRNLKHISISLLLKNFFVNYKTRSLEPTYHFDLCACVVRFSFFLIRGTSSHSTHRTFDRKASKKEAREYFPGL